MEKSRHQKLSEVRWYERNQLSGMSKDIRPSFHVSAPVGWINDPNGFSVYQDQYHLFYQYHPFKTAWGPMYWGHCKSDDMIRWEYLPAAIAPDEIYDNSGCFSGSAIEVDGEHVLVYTGVIEGYLGDGSEYKRQVQCIASGDGTDYEKWECNPVITGESLPEGFSLEDFRDPKIWKDEDTYYLIAGNRVNDGYGHVVLYRSKDLKQWEYITVIDQSNGEIGDMWECPDFFCLDNKQVLIISPQDMRAKGLEFHNGNGTVYITGDYDKTNYQFTREHIGAIDYGLDFYAPQTLLTKDGRRIMIAWMQSWDSHIVPKNFKWSGMMTIPREITLEDGKLIQQPVRELENYRQNAVTYENISITNTKNLEKISGRVIDLTVEITGGDYSRFRINFAQSDEYVTFLEFDTKTSILKFDRNHSGICRDVVCSRSIYADHQNGKLTLRLILDKYSAEIFVNNGKQALTAIYYTPQEADQISFDAEGEAIINITKYDIKTE